ncbi:hypothetical protein ACWGH5_14180 [Streptomyces sp. NPDC054864]
MAGPRSFPSAAPATRAEAGRGVTPGGCFSRGTAAGCGAPTIADLLLRPGALRARSGGGAASGAARPLPALAGAPVGVVGDGRAGRRGGRLPRVGGGVMTGPAMRRPGHTMRAATAAAGPFTLAVAHGDRGDAAHGMTTGGPGRAVRAVREWGG